MAKNLLISLIAGLIVGLAGYTFTRALRGNTKPQSSVQAESLNSAGMAYPVNSRPGRYFNLGFQIDRPGVFRWIGPVPSDSDSLNLTIDVECLEPQRTIRTAWQSEQRK